MRHYEVTFIVDPVLSAEDIKATAQTYVDQLKSLGCEITHVDEIGLQQLAYAIKKRTTGQYFCVEYTNESGSPIDTYELAMRRDDRVLRFLTVTLDKYGVKYNEDKREGKIGHIRRENNERKRAEEKKRQEERQKQRQNNRRRRN